MALTTEQSQTRFLAIVLPTLTLCTHTLLALSFLLPGADLDRAFLSVIYNVMAGSASILGLVGAIKLIPKLVSAFTTLHTVTLSFVTVALLTLVLPVDLRLVNPMIPSYRVDGSSICRDIDAGFGWDEEWLQACSKSLGAIKFAIASLGLVLLVAQWWALVNVRRWGKELRSLRRGQRDVENTGIPKRKDDAVMDDKTG
ncbi:hypothetical protein BDW02DRAFT_591119 [Decorospora gaudefroyi]|uniref:MARVEL domain-containing protein n=1 Tax=Decorospora gaudefroyi TaxID=184978 RepID=A0A6A5KDG4_9PLEO|nr:hypothetical protein BDW02DRAFT_591119 [Decorospora gaudefroyi]